jgi:hypothetical protein
VAWVVGLVVALVATGTATWATLSDGSNEEVSMAEVRGSSAVSGVTPDDLAVVARTKVFFGHQSVGMNVLDGIRAVYAANNLAVPTIEQRATPPSSDAGVIEHEFVGENKFPLRKIEDFAAKLRSGLGGSVDVAMMKLCYVDVVSDTNVDELFATYRQTMAQLQQEFPDVAFVHATVSLTTEQGWLSKVKRWVTGDTRSNAADNAARERLNTLIRNEYAGKNLFDLAAVESTMPDGTRTGGMHDGQQYFQLSSGYAADHGHLNEAGAYVAATAWLNVVAQAATR